MVGSGEFGWFDCRGIARADQAVDIGASSFCSFTTAQVGKTCPMQIIFLLGFWHYLDEYELLSLQGEPLGEQ